eukprot:TRINITY_DN8152_c0_g1_i1.p1 TRINITY_DN8152_c0_g1~~TRINITY_DN8152_c0_g1_i1.p1  ORF type:complete len:447 (+),score=56.87 TRINITY_DN8152_c0_g1_i1:52-1392(+)
MERSCRERLLLFGMPALFLVPLLLVLERRVRRSRLHRDMEGREGWTPNYGHVWNEHDLAYAKSGQWGNTSLNPFGELLREARNDWSRVCREDSDGDGLTNGEELGDPCCLWTPEAHGDHFDLASQHEYRRWAITHPGIRDKTNTEYFTSGGYRAATQPKDCGRYNAEEYNRQFEDFYYPPLRPGNPSRLNFEVVAAYASIVIYFVAVAHWFYHDLAADICPWLFPRKAVLSTRVACAALLASFVFMDLTTSIVHLFMDNCPRWLPILGQISRGFQFHHWDPTGIVRISWFAYVRTAFLLVPPIVALVHLSQVSRTCRLFWFWNCMAVPYFQTTHRWAHFQPDSLPDVVRLLQSTGLAMNHEHHIRHHRDLEFQFSIMSGCTDFVMDFLSYFLPCWRYDLWAVVGAAWFLSPILLDVKFRGLFEGLESTYEAKQQKKEEDIELCSSS